MHNNGLITSWEAFLRAVELRFAPSKFEDPVAALCKLTHMASLQEYLEEFEALSNRITGYPGSFYLSSFMAGLKPHIRRELLAKQPTDVVESIALAKLQEDKSKAATAFASRFNRPAQHYSSPSATITTNPKPLPPLLPTLPNKLPVKPFTEIEMQERRDKGLCYNCDEHYVCGHRCNPKFLLLIASESADHLPSLDSKSPHETEETPLEAGLISLNALSGQWSPRTFRVTGSLNGYEVQILVDSGATHNFIQSRVAQFLHLPLEPTPIQLHVMVGNGDCLPCSTFCPKAHFTLANL